MPTTYTHYAYGQDVFNKLPEQIQKSIEPYMEYMVRIYYFIIILIIKTM